MSRRKNREANSRAKRYQPMPWLSTCSTDQRPVFALTLQRMMSGCEMVDYGISTSNNNNNNNNNNNSSSNSTSTSSAEQDRLVVDLNAINVNVDNLKLQLADLNGNTILKETPALPDPSKQLLLESAEKLIIDEPSITYDYASIIEGVSSVENWWNDEVAEVNKLQNCISIGDSIANQQPHQQSQQVYDCSYELDNRLVELMPNSSSLVVTLPHYYEPYQSAEVQPSLIESNFGGRSGEILMNGQYCKIEVLDSGIRDDDKEFTELLNFDSTRSLQNQGFGDEITVCEMSSDKTDNSSKVDGRKRKKRKRDWDVEKSISCSRCGKKFKKEGHLKTHFVVHTMNENGASVCCCNVCGKSFCHRGALTLHMRAHAPKQTRNEIM